MKKFIKTFNKVITTTLLIGLLIGICIAIFFRNYTISFFIGLLMSLISFSINIIMTNYLLNGSSKNKHYLFACLNFFFRVVLVSVVGIVLVKINKYNIFSYILGYNCNILSLVICALKK